MQRNIYDPTKPFNEQIRRLIQDTHPQDGPIIIRPHGKRFRRMMDNDYWKDYDTQDATDGIGTKGLLHWLMGTHSDGVQGVFAMVMDDLMEGGFIPVYLQDHILIQEENDRHIFSLTGKLRDLCVQNPWETSDGRVYPIIITGGETAIINTIQGFEMGITATGYVRKGEEIIPNAQDGDVIIGLGSNGIHSNGLSFYREELFNKQSMRLDTMLPWGATVGEELTRPTYVYMPALKELVKELREYVHGMVHITGGGLSKLHELMPPQRDVDIGVTRNHPLEPQKLFFYAYDLGVPSGKMYTRFNNGVGYAIVMEKSRVEDALSVLKRHFQAEVIGGVTKGNGKVIIESQYDPSIVVFQ